MVDNNKILLAITPEEPVENEGKKIAALLQAGWYRVHVRHPHCSRTDIRTIIESIDQKYHKQIVLHGHYDLINDFNLGGLHLNRRCPKAPLLYNGSVSKSCHSIDELAECSDMAYVTLSPIFDSISKTEYHSTFSSNQLKELDKYDEPAIIALGGITPENIKSISRYNFGGYAMLGAIPWSEDVTSVREFASKKIVNL